MCVSPEREPAAVSVESAKTERAPDSSPRSCSEGELRAFVEAGKKHIAQEHYEDAKVALTQALSCRPGDAEALAERGLAWFLSNNLKIANDDLVDAARGATDKALLATIWYRRGLVDAQEFGEHDLKRAFAVSASIMPTEEARRKLGGAPDFCAVTIERTTPTAGGVPLEKQELARYQSNSKTLFGSLGPTGEGTFPSVVHIQLGGVDTWRFFVKSKNLYWAAPLSYVGFAPFGNVESEAAVIQSGVEVAHAHGYYRHWFGDVTHANGEVDIKVHDSPTQEVDAVVNVEADEALVIRRAIAGRYEERTSVPALKVSATRDGLVLTGVGCERRVIAWARRGP